MKWIELFAYTGEDLGLSAEDLMRALSDFFLQSGFESQYMQLQRDGRALARATEGGHRAGARDGDMFDQQMRGADPQKLEQHVAGADDQLSTASCRSSSKRATSTSKQRERQRASGNEQSRAT